MKRLIFILCLCHFQAYAELVDKTVAIVGKELILQSDTDELQRANTQEPLSFNDALQLLIDKAILVSECKKFAIYPTESEVKDQINDIKKQNNLDDNGMRMALLNMGMSLETYESQLYAELCKTKLIQSKIRNRVNISKQDIERVFQQRSRKKSDARLRLKGLAVTPKTKDRSDVEAAEQFAGDIFKALSTSNFETASQMIQSGMTVSPIDFGVISVSDTVREIADAVFSDLSKDIHGPIALDGSFYVFQVFERIKDETKPLVDEEKELHKQLFEAEIERLLKQYIAEAKASTYVEIF